MDLSIHQFIEILRPILILDVGEHITKKTKFKQLKAWSSLTALLVVGEIKEKYDVDLNFDDLTNSLVIEDIFNITIAKIAK